MFNLGIVPVSYLSYVPYSGLFTNDWGSSWEWTDGSPVDFLYWRPNYPDLTNPKPTTCASLTDTGLENYDCSAASAIVCKINLSPQTILHPPTTTAPKCSGNFSYFEATNSCYGVFYGNYAYGLTWDDSENVCKTFNGHLASIHSDEEYRYVYGISFYSYRTGTWAGLFSNDHGNTWRWSDGSPVDYIYWQPDAPYRTSGWNECGIMEYNGFLDSDCDRHVTFVCKIKL
uniref:C-type lectin domain-containing protein n=1 Tax=Panagrolaimus davidi TaxID=227884 RepID=A0A914P9Y5_9BILA